MESEDLISQLEGTFVYFKTTLFEAVVTTQLGRVLI